MLLRLVWALWEVGAAEHTVHRWEHCTAGVELWPMYCCCTAVNAGLPLCGDRSRHQCGVCSLDGVCTAVFDVWCTSNEWPAVAPNMDAVQASSLREDIICMSLHENS
jgi:hypothetical protein